MTANHMIMLNTQFTEIVYDPDYWFAMSEWKAEPTTTRRIAHILSFANMISDQLRRHGRLEYS
jgi:glutamine synthetase adenylyltransferase